MSDNMNQAMAKVVEGAPAIIVTTSEKYRNSGACKRGLYEGRLNVQKSKYENTINMQLHNEIDKVILRRYRGTARVENCGNEPPYLGSSSLNLINF